MPVKETVVHKMNRFSFPIFLMIILFIFPVVTEITASSALAAKGIHVDWTLQEIIKEVVPSQTIDKTVNFSFTLSKQFPIKYDVTLKVSSDLKPFISVNPKRIEKVVPNQTYTTQLLISIPSDTDPGQYEGKIRLFVRMHWVGVLWPKWKGRRASPNLKVLLNVSSQTVDLSVKHANDYPTRIAQGPDGKFYVTDALAGSVFIYNSHFDLHGKLIGIVGELKGFDSPLGIAVDSNGNIYVGNNGRDNVEVYQPDGRLKSIIDDGNISMPNDMALDNEDNLYVVDSLNNSVKVYDPSGELQREISGSGDNGGLNFPVAIAIHENQQGSEEVYVADQGNYKVQVFSLDGISLGSFGGKVNKEEGGGMGMGMGMGMGGGDTWNWNGLFLKIQSLAVDSQGLLHAADCKMNNVQMLEVDTGAYEDSYGTFGTGTGQLNLPLDLCITNDGKVVVTNAGNHRVEIIHTMTTP